MNSRRNVAFTIAFLVLVAGTLSTLAVSSWRSAMSLPVSILDGNVETGGVREAQIPREPPEGYRVYRSAAHGFSLFYPTSLTMREFDEGENARTIVFQSSAEAVGFQIFVAPYGLPHITRDRFLKDIPSGVLKSEKSVIVGGVPAVSFYSRSASLGETVDVWFIRGGHLFEVTTLASLEGFLNDVLSTWQFE